MADVHLFGIRHHGPGSARSVVHALKTVRPDIVLVEGPPDANDVLPLAAHEQLEPPVALLVYVPDSPHAAALYPFARYSPEWQAIQFALATGVPVQFIDLPQSARLRDPNTTVENEELPSDAVIRTDPLAPMALAAGYSDAEQWWDHLVESRHGHDIEVFQATHEMMSEVRAQLDASMPLLEQQREAHMRKCIRAATAQGYSRIAVVCGAYHTPALATMPSAKSDDALLKSLPKVKTAAAWVPWTYERLSYRSGYGAGVESPVWYELLWEKHSTLGARWMTRAARLLRDEDVPVSSAHVIESCRLADALAAVRNRPVPGLAEYNDAAISVFGVGNAPNIQLIARRWHYGDRLGSVPESFPAAPLQRDLSALQKRLRLPAKAEEKTYDLDLREANDRERSYLLRRLQIIGVDWGVPTTHTGGRGTFHELWQVRWQPEFAIVLIEASRYGHTLQQAAGAFIAEKASQRDATLGSLIALLESALFADLPQAIGGLVAAIEDRAAVATDVLHLLDALPALVNVHRYGNVRETDVSLIAAILAGLLPRIFIGVPAAVVNIDDDAAKALWEKLAAGDRAIGILAMDDHTSGWRDMLLRVARKDTAHPLLTGYACRLLYDINRMTFDEVASSLTLMLSRGNSSALAASWIEGLLSGSGQILIHDDRLRSLLANWLGSASKEHFIDVLPLLRRTFAKFPPAERRQIGERLRSTHPDAATPPATPSDFDTEAARAMLPVLQLIWNLKEPP